MVPFDEIRNRDIGQAFIDAVIEFGHEEATKIMQRAVNRVTGHLGLGLRVNGEFDETTAREINRLNPDDLLEQIKAYHVDFARDLAMKARAHDSH
jgi:lysozyme family protein